MTRKTKKSDREKAKDRVWKLCSKYVRTRDCLESTGDAEWGRCCTCGALKHITQLDAGHYISGRTNAILFVDEAIHIQCRKCNRFMEGNRHEYEKYMQNKYGPEYCEKLKNMKWMNKSLSVLELLGLDQDYKEKLRILEGKS